MNAAAANAAMIVCGRVVFQLRIQEYHADKEPGAQFTSDEVSVLPHPAKGRVRSPDLLHDRRWLLPCTIGAVLVKSFTITFPTVTVSTLNNVSNKADSETMVTQKIAAFLKSVQGVTHLETKTEENRSVITVSFRKNWDDLKSLNDVKRTLDRNKEDFLKS
jgi:hypothetical protein